MIVNRIYRIHKFQKILKKINNNLIKNKLIMIVISILIINIRENLNIKLKVLIYKILNIL